MPLSAYLVKLSMWKSSPMSFFFISVSPTCDPKDSVYLTSLTYHDSVLLTLSSCSYPAPSVTIISYLNSARASHWAPHSLFLALF
jgi:hypothetical protein